MTTINGREQAHEVMDEHLDWTIVCPGGQTSRDNLASALVACLDEPGTIGKDFALLEGDTPLAEALRGV
ncbi:MAG: hypothetical protein ACOCTI_02350 [Phycisphaeraceae bacterium]